jgi:hypothetical protein
MTACSSFTATLLRSPAATAALGSSEQRHLTSSYKRAATDQVAHGRHSALRALLAAKQVRQYCT